MTVYEAIHQILRLCDEARFAGEALPVDVRLLDALVRYERRRSGLPHPLHKYALNGSVRECPESEMLLDCVTELSLGQPCSIRRRSAEWFLLENRTVFFTACEKAGIDAHKLRRTIARLERIGKKRPWHVAAQK